VDWGPPDPVKTQQPRHRYATAKKWGTMDKI